MKRLVAVILVLQLTGPIAVARIASRVVVICLDGLRADAITAADAPRMSELRERGLEFTEAFNDLPSATLPNHATMLTGLTSARHQVLIDFEVPGRIATPTIFDFLHAANTPAAFFASKDKLAFVGPEADSATAMIDARQDELAEAVIAEIQRGEAAFIFVHFRDPDSTGHRAGWDSPEYRAAVSEVDERVGRIADALDADFARASYLLLTADHGGAGPNHFVNIDANRRIPWIVIGPDVAPGAQRNETVSTADLTPTVLWLLNLDEPPDLDGRVQEGIRGGAAPDAPAPIAPVGIPCLLFFAPLLAISAYLQGRAASRVGRRGAGCA